jgi:hypothetical protein
MGREPSWSSVDGCEFTSTDRSRPLRPPWDRYAKIAITCFPWRLHPGGRCLGAGRMFARLDRTHRSLMRAVPARGSSGRRCILIGARDRGPDASKMSWPTWGQKSGGMRGNARTDGRRQPRGRGPARASGHVPRARRDQPSRGMARGFSGRWSPRLHVVKQERPRVTAVLCRGIFRATASRAPSRNLATPSGFPRASGERSSGPIVALALGHRRPLR